MKYAQAKVCRYRPGPTPDPNPDPNPTPNPNANPNPTPNPDPNRDPNPNQPPMPSSSSWHTRPEGQQGSVQLVDASLQAPR